MKESDRDPPEVPVLGVTNSIFCHHLRIGFTLTIEGGVYTQTGPLCLGCGELFPDHRDAAYLILVADIVRRA
jgi:hypothetical protein